MTEDNKTELTTIDDNNSTPKEKKEVHRPAYKAICEEQAAEILRLRAQLEYHNTVEVDQLQIPQYAQHIDKYIIKIIAIHQELSTTTVYRRPKLLQRYNKLLGLLGIAIDDFKKLYKIEFHSVSLDILHNILHKTK